MNTCYKCNTNDVHLIFSTDDTDGIIHYQWYAVCSCGNHTLGNETQEEAIKAWNRINKL